MANTNNLRISANLGLQNTYGIFKLNASVAESTINVNIYTSGKSYVESEETSTLHAGESGYSEFEGIYPIDSPTWDLSGLGKVFIDKLSAYFKSEEVEGVEGGEIYDIEGYKNYKNQFEITFEDEIPQDLEENLEENLGEDSLEGNDEENNDPLETTLLLYYDYQHNVVSFNSSDPHISKTWGEINDTGFLYGKVKIINHSKYYSIHSIDNTVLSPLLKPLLYNADDLDKYGLGIDDDNIPYVKYMWGLTFFFGGGSGADENTQFYNGIHLYNTLDKCYNMEHEGEVSGTWIEWEDDDGVGDVSPFNTNYGSYPTLRNRRRDWWDEQFPKGFVLFGMMMETSVTQAFNKDGKHSTNQISYNYPQEFRNTFNLVDYTYNFDRKHVRGDGETPLVGIVYNGDSIGNIHFINNWFAVKSKSYSEPRQEINYKDSAKDIHPQYIGLVIASVLANIYTYSDSVGNSIAYVADIVYLKDYSTIYTKDIIYEASSTASDNNELVVFHSTTLKDYVTALKKHLTPTELNQMSNKNVTAIVKSCIKNVPILFKMNYIQPGMELVGVKSAKAKVRTIEGKEYDVVLNSNNKDDLYQVSLTKSGLTANIINEKFKVKYLLSLHLDGNTLKGEYNTALPEEICPDIQRTFKLEGDQLGFKNTSYTGQSCYSIVTDFHEEVNYTHFIKDEVMVPFAKLF